MSSFLHIADQARSRGKVTASKRVENNTYAERYPGNGTLDEPDAVGVRLHDTTVVKYTKTGELVLSTGGWRTVTTKDRINGYTPSDICVYSDKGEWRVKYTSKWAGGSSVAFADGITFEINTLAGIGWTPVEGTYPTETQEQVLREARKRFRKQVKAYAAKYDAAATTWAKTIAETGTLSVAGDCWFCLPMQEPGKSPAMGVDHIWSHLQEGYVMVSLALAAYRHHGYGSPELVMQMDMRSGDRVSREVERYLLKVLDPALRPSEGQVAVAGRERHVETARQVLEMPGDFGYFGADERLWKSSAPTWTKTRDSSNAELANFQVVWNTLTTEFPELVPADIDEEGYVDRDFNGGPALYVFGQGHWAVGHIDQIVVPVLLDPDQPLGADNLHPAFLRVQELREAYEVYPMLDGAEELEAAMDRSDLERDIDQTLGFLDEPELTAARDKIVEYAVREGASEWGWSTDAVREAYAATA